jgi:hypothetical protein
MSLRLPAVKPLSQQASRALDKANFFLADVRDGLGPYLAIYLLSIQKWDEASIGLVMSIATGAGILAQTPAGAVPSFACAFSLSEHHQKADQGDQHVRRW